MIYHSVNIFIFSNYIRFTITIYTWMKERIIIIKILKQHIPILMNWNIRKQIIFLIYSNSILIIRIYEKISKSKSKFQSKSFTKLTTKICRNIFNKSSIKNYKKFYAFIILRNKITKCSCFEEYRLRITDAKFIKR